MNGVPEIPAGDPRRAAKDDPDGAASGIMPAATTEAAPLGGGGSASTMEALSACDGHAAPPTGGGHGGDPYAWGLALSPLLTVPLALAGFGYALALLVRLGATVALVIADRRELSRSNRPPAGAPPAVAWFLIPEAYLFKRARRLGRPQTLFWAMLGCEAATFALGLALVAATVATATQPAETGPVLPGCDASASTDDVLSVFGDIPDVRPAGLRGVVLTNRTEFAQGPGRVPSERICEGTIEASDTKRYDVMYGFEIIQGRVIVRVAMK